MATNEEEVWRLVRAIHRRFDIHQCYGKCLLFMVDCLQAARAILPDRARESLDLAERYCNGRATRAQLDAERKRLWVYLSDNDLTYAFEMRRARLLRATLCVLYAEPGEDADVYKVLEWFMQMYDPAGQRAASTLALLTLRFGDGMKQDEGK